MEKLECAKHKRLFFIQIMRIVASIGVFTGHFLGHTFHSEMSFSLLSWLRNGFMSRTIFSYCWQGDSDVVLFFVLSGFFITYCQNDGTVKFLPEKLMKKLCYILVPSFVVILLSVGCSFILKALRYDAIAIKEEAIVAIKRLIFVGWSENSPRFSYQLWYINTLMKCYFISYIYISASANNKIIRRSMYPILLLVVWKYGFSYVVYIVGMICGEVCSFLECKRYKCNTFGAVAGIIALIISPFLFNQQHSSLDNKILLGVAIGIFILGMYWTGGKILDSKSTIIDWMDKNSFSFYLVHVLFLETISIGIYRLGMYIFDGKYEEGILLIDYAISLLGIWCLANLYQKYIVHYIMRGVSRVIEYLKSKQVL